MYLQGKKMFDKVLRVPGGPAVADEGDGSTVKLKKVAKKAEPKAPSVLAVANASKLETASKVATGSIGARELGALQKAVLTDLQVATVAMQDAKVLVQDNLHKAPEELDVLVADLNAKIELYKVASASFKKQMK